jgi:hypothetical protein
VYKLVQKIKNQNELPSKSFILDKAIQIAKRFIKANYGRLGSYEFRIDDIKYDARSNAFRIRLIRSINELSIRYELTIDSESGKPIRFRRLQ